MFAVLISCLSILVTSSFSARILGIVSIVSYSHQIVFQPLWRELSLKGHQVVVLTTDPIKDPTLTNLTEIDLHGSYDLWNVMDFVVETDMSVFRRGERLIEIYKKIAEYQLGHTDVQTIINNEKEHFDLVLVESIILSTVTFAARFKCPFILITSLDCANTMHEIIGNPTHPLLYPDYMITFLDKTTVYERLLTVAESLYFKYHNNYQYLPSQQEIADKYFGKDYPRITDILANASMMFLNTHPILHQVRPMVPGVIQIGGGLHFGNPKSLSKDLQNFLDDSIEGFIYFSLGTNVQSRWLSDERRQIILETFSELPFKVLWKFELEDLSEKPQNVLLSNWFPQQDVFRHSNIKLFITQCGLQSIEEAIYNHVPMVAMPFFGDQGVNSLKIESMGIGVAIDHKMLDKKTFKGAILEVINNPKYRNEIRKLSDLLKDQQNTGLERAVWWTEYVLRHGAITHLLNIDTKLPFYQYLFLDIIGVCVIALGIFIFIIVRFVKLIYRISVCNLKNKTKVQ